MAVYNGSYVAAGFRTDLKNLIEKFTALKTLRYNEFAEIWRELKFPHIYYSHGTLEELIEFTEEIFRITKEVWLKSEALNEQAGGMYTLYGLYLKQPTDGFVKVRIVPQDYDFMQKFQVSLRGGGHHDTNYIFSRMLAIGAFRFCISEFSYGVEKPYRRYHEKDFSLREVNEEPAYLKRLRNDDIFSKLDDAFKAYHKSKCNLVSENATVPPQNLDYVDSDFGVKLKEQFHKITKGDLLTLENDSNGNKNSSKIEGNNSGTTYKPWWMIPRKTNQPIDTSSESDPDDVDEPKQSQEKKKNSHKKKENTCDFLYVDGGVSTEEDGDGDATSIVVNSPQPSCSYNMPALQ